MFSGLENEDIINALEIRVVSLRRSGHHAFIFWMANNCSGRGCIVNKPPLDCNIYSYTGDSWRYPGNGLFSMDINKERAGEFSKKDYLIYNTENMDLRILSDDRVEENHDRHIGKSKSRYDIIVLRDPFNYFASTLQNYYVKGGKHSCGELFNTSGFLWKQYAREYLRVTDYLKHGKVCLNYNLWFTSETERKNIGQKLGLDIRNNKLDFTPAFGGGSSFEGTDRHFKASSTGVLERWKYFSQSHLFKKYFDDEIIALSEKIFGYIPGTDIFYPVKMNYRQRCSSAFRVCLEKYPLTIKYYKKNYKRLILILLFRHCPVLYAAFKKINNYVISKVSWIKTISGKSAL